MSREIFLKSQTKTLLAGNKNYTNTKLLALNNNIMDMFAQVDTQLAALISRVASLENSIGLFYLDDDGDVSQRDDNDNNTQEQEQEA